MQRCEIVGSNSRYQIYEERVIAMIGKHPDTSDITVIYHGVYDDTGRVLEKLKEIVSRRGKYNSILIRPSCANDPEYSNYLISCNIEYPEEEEKLTFICDREDMHRSFATLNYLHALMEILNREL